ncbi:uncharacterized protein UV8b_06572 [Ustilaginoidea virens]|uniref:Uncharacterized protein n=1 Tax=Ustilaginoidea virens TaxID=1159556 RepID=A0A8E5HVK1_USTVR|nr:uncharacterized protein UV8b_06572 [Ustilaginoidea virens]QUC22331.1 hypothetical protein UV8b_06572 [Ustilaginoidea virens]
MQKPRRLAAPGVSMEASEKRREAARSGEKRRDDEGVQEAGKSRVADGLLRAEGLVDVVDVVDVVDLVEVGGDDLV